MHASRQEVPVAIQDGGFEGRYADWGEFNVGFESIPGGTDPAALFVGLPDDRCPCPHWGFLFRGRMILRYGDHTETVSGGQAFYAAPGHLPLYEEDCEVLKFSPRDQYERVLAVVERG